MRIVRAIVVVLVGACVLSPVRALAEWEPRGIVPSTASVRDVLETTRRASGEDDPRVMHRREHWTYANNGRRIGVDVAVAGDDFRTSLDLDGLTYMAGRKGGARWRGDGNGVVHGVQADLQGDPADRAPQALFPLDAEGCTLAGETTLPVPAWVVRTDPPGDKAAFLFIEKTSGSIVREVVRDGKNVVTTTFDRFAPFASGRRPRSWHVEDGVRGDTLEVTVDAIETAATTQADVAFPERRVFAREPEEASVDLPVTFAQNGWPLVGVDVAGRRATFILDTGTASITTDPGFIRRYPSTLGHTVLPRLAAGALRLDRVSALTVELPAYPGILGFDFFFGHVVEIDYRRRRVRVLSSTDAQRVFRDASTTVVPANVDQGLPLVPASFGRASSDLFAIDTGSPRLYVTRPFAERYASEIGANWHRYGRPFMEYYLEGSIQVQPYLAPEFHFASGRARDVIVGAQIPSEVGTNLAVPYDGIIGTNVLRNFDLYFDYENNRIGVR